jgi:hypothetical protein
MNNMDLYYFNESLLESFDFDSVEPNSYDLAKNVTKHILTQYGTHDHNLYDGFINEVFEKYNNNNHYHNFYHAVNVMHMTYLLLQKLNLSNKLTENFKIAILIAALCHDVGHPGNNNKYEVNSGSQLAIEYNYTSVLENYHCKLTLELIKKYNLDVSITNKKDEHQFRQIIVSAIMATDFSKHCDFMLKLNAFNFNKESFTENEQYFIASAIVVLSDLSNSIKKNDVAYRWSYKISLENNEQFLKERELKGNCMTTTFIKTVNEMALNEINFIENVTMPLWSTVVIKFPELNELLERCQNTLIFWKSFL